MSKGKAPHHCYVGGQGGGGYSHTVPRVPWGDRQAPHASVGG